MSKSFRCNIYKKQGEGGQLLLTRNRGKRSSHASVETTCQWFPTDFRPGKIDKHIGIRKASEMKRIALAAWLSAGLLISGGCKNQPSDNDAIRAGILRHLNGVGTLNMSAMEMEMRTVSVNGNQARAEVVFRPKTGAPPGADAKASSRSGAPASGRWPSFRCSCAWRRGAGRTFPAPWRSSSGTPIADSATR